MNWLQDRSLWSLVIPLLLHYCFREVAQLETGFLLCWTWSDCDVQLQLWVTIAELHLWWAYFESVAWSDVWDDFWLYAWEWTHLWLFRSLDSIVGEQCRLCTHATEQNFRNLPRIIANSLLCALLLTHRACINVFHYIMAVIAFNVQTLWLSVNLSYHVSSVLDAMRKPCLTI